MYELVFYKLLAYVFGSSTLAVTTVLVAFMGGLAVGGRLIGARADRVARPIALYGWLELAIGAYVLFVPMLLAACVRLYAALGVSADAHELRHVAARFVLSVAVLILPTLLMGGTLPLLARALVDSRAGAERELSRLYAINTIGATVGTLLANYVLLRYLGIHATLCVGALANAYIYWKARRLDAALPANGAAKPGAVDANTGRADPGLRPGLAHIGGDRQFRLAIVAAFAVGVLSFVYEVVWTHLLATIVGMSVYAFGLMLATFLFGIALGSALVARGVFPSLPRVLLIAGAQFALGGFVLLSLPLWDKLPYVFAFVGQYGPSFFAMEATRAAVCCAVLLLPCVAIGATFPLLLRAAAFEPKHIGRRVGLLYASNTLGCILGAALTGFLLLEWLGSRTLLLWAAGASLAIGIAHVGMQRERRLRRVALASVLSLAAVACVELSFPAWNLKALAAGMNVHFNRGAKIAEVLWSKEDPQGGFTTVTREHRGLTLRTNGKFQADDHTELAAQQGFALIPLLFVPRYGAALNVGYGSGVTAGVLGRFPFERIEIAELSRTIVEASDRYFGHINFSELRDQRTEFFFNDGRNHLFVRRSKYDLITVEITSIWFAGAASLYGQEFYRLCREHLAQDGVLQQWVQFHHIDRTDLLVLWNTIRSVFPYVSLWRRGTQGALIASMRPQQMRYLHIQGMNELSTASVVRERLNPPDFFTLIGSQQLDARGLDDILGELKRSLPGWLIPYAVSRDYFPYLEYSTPAGYALPDSVEAENFAWIERFNRHAPPAIAGVPDERARNRIEALVAAGAGDCGRVLTLTRGPLRILDAALLRARLGCERGGKEYKP